jgi:hypothetical protein
VHVQQKLDYSCTIVFWICNLLSSIFVSFLYHNRISCWMMFLFLFAHPMFSYKIWLSQCTISVRLTSEYVVKIFVLLTPAQRKDLCIARIITHFKYWVRLFIVCVICYFMRWILGLTVLLIRKLQSSQSNFDWTVIV